MSQVITFDSIIYYLKYGNTTEITWLTGSTAISGGSRIKIHL